MADLRQVLKDELIFAQGCTEPIAIALCAAKARELLGRLPERMNLACSGNVIKNAFSVTVPNAGGGTGIQTAAALGCFGGDAARGLEVLVPATAAQLAAAQAFIEAGKISLDLAEGVDNLYIRVCLEAGEHASEAVISGSHTHFSFLKKDGQVLLQEEASSEAEDINQPLNLSLSEIIRFAETLDFSTDAELKSLLEEQIRCNLAIAEEGLAGDYGAGIGKTLLATYPDDLRTKLRAYAAAGSDARMAGSPLPVVINSGSGNQGLTSSLPIIIYARETGIKKEMLLKALAFSNLTAIYIKRLIGRMSAFCGAVSAGAAAGAGLAYLKGYNQEDIGQVISTTLLTSGGLLCDGAKASCAAKIAIALENALMALDMLQQGRRLPEAQGLAGKTVDETIANVAAVAREGMKETDVVILRRMLRS